MATSTSTSQTVTEEIAPSTPIKTGNLTSSASSSLSSSSSSSQPSSFSPIIKAGYMLFLYAISLLPMVWLAFTSCIFLLWVPPSNSVWINLVLLQVMLLLFISSAVRLGDLAVRGFVCSLLVALTAYHFANGTLTLGLSFTTVVYLTWIFSAVRPYFDQGLGFHTRAWHAFQRMAIWRWMEQHYFPITLVRSKPNPTKLDPSRRYLFVYHPHGLWPWGCWTSFVSSQWDALFPGITWRIMMSTPLLMLPAVGDYMQWIGGICATREAASKAIAAGHSISILPGGLAEAILSSPTEQAILLKPRRGFVKLAMSLGLAIVPMYGFGETTLYQQPSAFRELRLKLTRKLGFPITIFGGALWSGVPLGKPVKVVVGEPIEVPKTENPSAEEVEALYAQYEASLLQLYNDNAPPNAPPLVIT